MLSPHVRVSSKSQLSDGFPSQNSGCKRASPSELYTGFTIPKMPRESINCEISWNTRIFHWGKIVLICAGNSVNISEEAADWTV
jgi:hypothetical protein